jgi:hypothetical protein
LLIRLILKFVVRFSQTEACYEKLEHQLNQFESIDATRFFETVWFIIYRRDFCGVWYYAYANRDARAHKYGFAVKYTKHNSERDTDRECNAYHHVNANTAAICKR